jgi:hypothetical protein
MRFTAPEDASGSESLVRPFNRWYCVQMLLRPAELRATGIEECVAWAGV